MQYNILMSSLFLTLKSIFSGDTLFIVIAFAFFFGYAMLLGRGKIVSLILAYYPAVLLFNSFPFVNNLLVLQGDIMLTLNKIAIFLLFLAPLSILISRFVISESMHIGSSHFFRTAAFALCATALVLIFSYSTVSLDALHDFSPQIDLLFSSISRIFYWNTGILALFAFL